MKSPCKDPMIRFLRSRSSYWVGSLGSWYMSELRNVVWKHSSFGRFMCHRLSPAPPQSTAPPEASPQSEVGENLLEILMALRTIHGKLNIEGLSLNFQKEDYSFSGSLPPPKVTKIRVPVCSSPEPTSGSSRKRSYNLCSAHGSHLQLFVFCA